MSEDSISRQAAIGSIMEEPSKARYPVFYAEKNAEKIRRLPSAQPEQRWIPVTEQTLPRENSTVVAIGKTATWDVGNYRGHAESNIHRWYWKKNTMKDVYWWMYKKDALPKPYERSEDASNEG